MPDLVRDDLVYGNAGVNVRTGCFLDAHASKESAAGPGMIAGAIRTRSRVDVIHTAEDLQLLLQLRQWLHRGCKLELLAVAFGPPVWLDRAVWEIDESHAQRRAGGSAGEFGRFGSSRTRAQGANRFKRRQRQTSAKATQEMAAGETRKTFRGKVLVALHGIHLASTTCSDG